MKQLAAYVPHLSITQCNEMSIEGSGGTDPTGSTSGLRAAWPYSTWGGAHRPNTMAGTSYLTNVMPVGMTGPGAR